MLTTKRPLAIAAAALSVLAAAATSVAQAPPPQTPGGDGAPPADGTPGGPAPTPPPREGRIGPEFNLTGNGRLLRPAGRLTTLGNFPTGGALTPDGRFYWVVDAGHGANDVKVVEIATGKVVQTLPLPGAYVGVAFAPDGRTAFVSGAAKGSSTPAGPTLGDGGDVIHQFTIDPQTGQGSDERLVTLSNIPPGGRGRTTDTLLPTNKAYAEGLTVSPDGKTLVVALNQADQVALIDIATKQTRYVRVGEYPYTAVVSKDSTKAYVSNELSGTISVVELASGDVLTNIPVGGPPGDPAVGGPLGDPNSHPQGMALDPKRPLLYVAVANRDLIAVVDLDQNRATRFVDVGRREALGTSPVTVAVTPDGSTLYSANAGEDALAAIALTGRVAGRPRRVVALRSPAQIARYAQEVKKLQRRFRRGARDPRFRRRLKPLQRRLLRGPTSQACSGPSKRQEGRLYVPRVQRAVRRRRTGLQKARTKAERARVTRRYRRDLKAARRGIPMRIRPCGTSEPFELIGRIPTAAYTQDVQVTPDGAKLVWLAGKGLGAGPNTGSDDLTNSPAKTEYVLQKLIGRAGVLDTPSDVGIRKLTPVADRQVRPANLPASPPAGTPVIGPNGGPSDKIKYVFYVVRENRTYDQGFGADPRGDGDPARELFGDNGKPGPTGGVTPNAHALSRRFPLLDHVYANSEVSVDGHIITTGGYAIDYVQKSTAHNYSDRGRAFDFGLYNVTLAPNFSLFDQAVRQNQSFRHYGEASAGTFEGNARNGENRPTNDAVQAGGDETYPSQALYGCVGTRTPTGSVGCVHDSGSLAGTTGPPPGNISRFDDFKMDFESQVAGGTLPTFNYLTVPNDHTAGATSGNYTPQAFLADNDLALGQLVQLISSKPDIWKQSAIFVIEDDSQDGSDHVDAHRTPAFVISPHARSGLVTTRYDQYSVLKTIELILGLRSLSLNDALATPMFDAFRNDGSSDASAYQAIQPEQSITEKNGEPSLPGGASLPASVRLSNALPFEDIDLVPQRTLDRILWKSVHGEGSSPPGPGPNASPAERQRAVEAMEIYRGGGPDVKEELERFLEATGEVEEEE